MAAKKSSAKVGPKGKLTVAKPAPKKAALAKAALAKAAKKAAPAKAAQPPAPSKATAGSAKAVAEGSKAPSFTLPDETGAVVSSASLAGKPYVLYFYPKDDTPGCTKEACDFRDNLRAFNAAKVRVLGVSADDAKRHAKFKAKYGLTFTLLADTEKSLIHAYGVWVKKLNYGREYMGVQRSTFLIDKDGKVAEAWHGVRVPGHVEAVLAAL
ncbi:MAG: thioredoxin-dependent thiol peroxidase [Polyangiaceae bacterium]